MISKKKYSVILRHEHDTNCEEGGIMTQDTGIYQLDVEIRRRATAAARTRESSDRTEAFTICSLPRKKLVGVHPQDQSTK